MDVKAEVKADLTSAVKAVSDIVTYTHKGVSKLIRAFVGPWIEERVRKAELLAAQTVKDCADIKAGVVTYAENKLLRFEPQPTVASSFDMLHTLNHASDAKRLHAAMQEAARQISEVPEEQVSDEPLSQDFFNHWRREAEMIDDEELRKWWASLLAEEAKTPNSISPRTLDVAKNLSKDEAQIFQRMMKGGVAVKVNHEWKYMIPINSKAEPFGMGYEEALAMGDAGLLSLNQAYSISGTCARSKDLVIYELTLLDSDWNIYMKCKEGNSICGYFFTVAGLELARMMLEHRSLDTVIEIAKFLHNVYPDREFMVCNSLEFKSLVWSSKIDGMIK